MNHFNQYDANIMADIWSLNWKPQQKFRMEKKIKSGRAMFYTDWYVTCDKDVIDHYGEMSFYPSKFRHV